MSRQPSNLTIADLGAVIHGRGDDYVFITGYVTDGPRDCRSRRAFVKLTRSEAARIGQTLIASAADDPQWLPKREA